MKTQFSKHAVRSSVKKCTFYYCVKNTQYINNYMIGIYAIKNKKGVPVYVGQSKGVFRRWATHELNDYPSTEYTFEVLETCERHELISKEKKWITQLDTYYNGDNKTNKRKRVRIKRQSMNIDGKDKRRRWLKNQLAKSICNCGEQQPHRLMFYPHHKKIRHLNMRYGLKHSSREETNRLISESTVLCWNCAADQKEDLSMFL